MQTRTDEQLEVEIEAAMRRCPNGIYNHKASGKRYYVNRIEFREKDLTLEVSYSRWNRPLLNFNRPLDEFLEKFERMDTWNPLEKA